MVEHRFVITRRKDHRDAALGNVWNTPLVRFRSARLWIVATLVYLMVQAISLAQIPNPLLRKQESQSLPNLIRVTNDVYSGGLPHGQLGMAELQQLGIKTVLSVDGMKPDVAMAAQFGLQYVHLPHGYDGISPDRLRELAVALEDLPKPIYVHCHHGKHRSPTAVAAACVSNGQLDRESGVKLLQIAGTDSEYSGLYRTVTNANRMSEQMLRSKPVTFVASATVPPTIDRMVAMDELLQTLVKWESGPSTPSEAAILLAESYRELARLEETQLRPRGYQQMLADGESLSRKLLDHMRAKHAGIGIPSEQTKETLNSIRTNCKQCHQSFRN